MRPEHSVRELAQLLRIEQTFLEECLRCGAVAWDERPEEPEVSPARLARLRRLQRLCLSLDIDVFAGSVIVDLLDQMDELQRELDRLHGREP